MGEHLNQHARDDKAVRGPSTLHVMRKPQQPHQLLEQELETLSAGQDGNEDHARKRIRVIKNRLSAKKSREQARDYVHKLESSLNALMAQNQSLARRLTSVEFENEALRQRQPRPRARTTLTPAEQSKSQQWMWFW